MTSSLSLENANEDGSSHQCAAPPSRVQDGRVTVDVTWTQGPPPLR
eukprot:CAMPEP_0113566152 /NCGR_PEP_ID=MMETSP0015_2-20120614/22569_1 /TAXON_ID=2838 /ORGANISM="Odontella" /LENGTH=45 /DNA_ID=CAMNT_0000468419 /DNA_START=369 /DNA_END=503 /DNA_ORIENTATION=+ /assembly_acc=CAM_ASM_000160